jgi:hypothetical protein
VLILGFLYAGAEDTAEKCFAVLYLELSGEK